MSRIRSKIRVADSPEWKEVMEIFAIGLKPHEAVKVEMPLFDGEKPESKARIQRAARFHDSLRHHTNRLHLAYDVIRRGPVITIAGR